MESKIVVLVVIAMLSQCKGESVPDSIQELQRIFGDGTNHDEYSNAYYEVLLHAQGLRKQAANQLKSHLTGNEMYGFDEDHIEEFVKNMQLISQTKVETEQDIEVLRNQLYHSEDFQTELLMEQLLFNRDDSEEAQAAFDEVFLKFNANSVVQLYYTDDEDIFSGVIIAAKRKNSHRAVYLVFVMD